MKIHELKSYPVVKYQGNTSNRLNKTQSKCSGCGKDCNPVIVRPTKDMEYRFCSDCIQEYWKLPVVTHKTKTI